MKREVETATSIDDTSLKRPKLQVGDTDATGADTEMTIQNAEADKMEATHGNSSQQNGKGRGRGKGKGKEKDGKVWESRRRRGTRAEGSDLAEGPGNTEEKEKAPRLPKRQCALLIGFCGSGYNGMQM